MPIQFDATCYLHFCRTSTVSQTRSAIKSLSRVGWYSSIGSTICVSCVRVKSGIFSCLPYRAFHGTNLPIEGGLERTGFCLGDQGLGDNLKGIIYDIGEKPRALVEDGAVVKAAVPGNDGNVIEMSVVVEYKTVNFKQQCEILRESGKTGNICGFFSQVGHSLFVAGHAA